MRVKMWHCSMQYNDTSAQHTADANKVFKLAKANNVSWVTGTESGHSSGNLSAALKAAAKANGYRHYNVDKTDAWLAVRNDLIKSDWVGRYQSVSKGIAHVHGDRGILSVTFTSTKLGVLTIGTAHPMTKGQKPGDPFYAENTKYVHAIGDWAKKYGAGGHRVFFGGDMNMQDRHNDTFRGAPLTSCWDELKVWPGTHGAHSVIDVIASYDKDTSVSCVSGRAFPDNKVFLHTDHYLIEAVYEVPEPKA